MFKKIATKNTLNLKFSIDRKPYSSEKLEYVSLAKLK